MFLTKPTRVVAMVAAVMLSVASPAAAEDAAASVPLESSVDTGPVDVATISFDDATMRLGAEDGTGQARDPESVVYTTERSGDGVEVGWDTGGIGAGEVFGDAVVLRLRAAEGPAEFHAEPLRLPAGDQGATTWTFSAPGTYTLTFAVEANLLTGEPLDTEEHYTVAVQAAQDDTPEPPAVPVSPSPPAVLAAPAAENPSVNALPVAPRAAQPAPATPGRVVLDEGHVDAVAPRLLGGRLQIQVKDGTTVGRPGGRVHWREPGDVMFRVKPGARTALPDDPALAFLGKPGDEIFLLPQQQQPDILWTGWSTEELRADQVSGPVTWRLTEVDGPGAFGIFTTGSFGESTTIFNSADGLPDGHSVALGTHAHANWGFAKQGVYRLTFDATARLSNGRTVSDSATYTFTVDDADTDTGGDDATRGGGAGGESDDPGLAYTGVAGVLPLAAGGVVLLGLGGVAVGRRRRNSENR